MPENPLAAASTDTDLTDEQLLELYLTTKDDKHFDALHSRHAADLHKCLFTKYLDSNVDHTDDLVQQTFLKLIEEVDTYDRSKKLAPWLFSIGINLAINFKRDSANRFAHSFEEWKAIGQPNNENHSNFDPKDYREDDFKVILTVAERAEKVNDAIATLSEGDRAAVQLIYFEGCTQQQAAERLGIPLGSLKVRMRRAHRLLKIRLGHDILEAA